VVRFPNLDVDGGQLRVPNIGWSKVWSPQVGESSESPYMYFVHSFYAVPSETSAIHEVSKHGGHEFCASIRHGTVTGTQYHPENSGAAGLRVLGRWLNHLTYQEK
jgi:glutamine amidotransferase